MTAWLLAFLVHSTLWLGLAWLWTRLRPNMHARMREAVWVTAILASLITPTVQGLASENGALWSVPVLTAWSAPAEAEHEEVVALGEHGERAESHSEEESHEPTVASAGPGWETFALAAWLLAAGALLLRYLVGVVTLRRQIASQEIQDSSPERNALSDLSRRAGLRRAPRLTESENVGSPSALGFGVRAEICVPTRALHELDDEQFDAMLGHEVAHHMRRDPLRFAMLNLLRKVLFFQPLLHVAGKHIHLAAEEQCDAWAANHSGDRLAMASCLTEVASWVLPRHGRLQIAGMAGRRSHLGVRVRRLIEDQRGFEAPGKLMRRFGSVGLLVLAPWLAPNVAPVIQAESAEHLESRAEEPQPGREHGGEHREGRERGDEHGGGRERGHDEQLPSLDEMRVEIEFLLRTLEELRSEVKKDG